MLDGLDREFNHFSIWPPPSSLGGAMILHQPMRADHLVPTDLVSVERMIGRRITCSTDARSVGAEIRNDSCWCKIISPPSELGGVNRKLFQSHSYLSHALLTEHDL